MRSHHSFTLECAGGTSSTHSGGLAYARTSGDWLGETNSLTTLDGAEVQVSSSLIQDVKPRILFVCTVNRMRSATAHKIYENDDRFEVDSAGTDRTANVVLEEWHLEWADAIVVMEKQHRNKIRERFPTLYEKKPIVCLYIEDIYDFMQPELVAILREKFEDVYRHGLLN